MSHRELLIAISELEPVRVRDRYERHSSLRRPDMAPSAAGGRWGPRNAFEVLYLGRPRESVVAEAYRHLVDDEMDAAAQLAATVIERRITTCDVDVGNVLDLRPTENRVAIGIEEDELHSDVGDYARCQAVAAGAHQLELSGVIAPDASSLGETLALFPTNMPVEDWPVVVEREIWRQLPPDPRRLRLVDEAT